MHFAGRLVGLKESTEPSLIARKKSGAIRGKLSNRPGESNDAAVLQPEVFRILNGTHNLHGCLIESRSFGPQVNRHHHFELTSNRASIECVAA